MGTRFRVRIGEDEAVCELLEDLAPNVSAAFLRSLPLESIVTHAKFSGHELITMVPFWTEAENLRPDGCVEGDVAFSPSRQTVCLFYNRADPLSNAAGQPGNAFARLVEGKAAMERAAERVLEHGSLPVAMFLDGQQPGASVLPPLSSQTSLTPRLRAALESIWSREPADTQALRSYTRPPMGNLPSVIHAFADFYWLNENLHACQKVAAGPAGLAAANPITAALLGQVRGRLMRWGMKDTVALLSDCIGYFETGGPSTLDEFLAVTRDLLIVVDRLLTWVDVQIPWQRMDAALGPAGRNGNLSPAQARA